MGKQNDDPLGNEVSASGKLTETGIEGKAKSRAIAAFDRLVGNILDLANPSLEGRAERKRAKNRQEANLIEAIGQMAVEKLQTDPDLAQRAVEDMLEKSIRQRENKEAVVIQALEELKELPSPEDAKPEPDQPDAVDDDWLNFFEEYAEKASSAGLRQIWGRILAGEIQKPNSFSFTTMRIVSELNPDIARRFEDIASARFGHDAIVRPQGIEGERLKNLISLEDVGLISQVNGQLSRVHNSSEAGLLRIPIGGMVLALKLKNPKSNEIQIPAMVLTQAGQQLSEVIQSDNLKACRQIVHAVEGSIEQASAHQLKREPDGRFRVVEGTEIRLFPSELTD